MSRNDLKKKIAVQGRERGEFFFVDRGRERGEQINRPIGKSERERKVRNGRERRGGGRKGQKTIQYTANIQKIVRLEFLNGLDHMNTTTQISHNYTLYQQKHMYGTYTNNTHVVS